MPQIHVEGEGNACFERPLRKVSFRSGSLPLGSEWGWLFGSLLPPPLLSVRRLRRSLFEGQLGLVGPIACFCLKYHLIELTATHSGIMEAPPGDTGRDGERTCTGKNL